MQFPSNSPETRALETVTDCLAVCDGFVILALDTDAHTVRFFEETAMIVNAQHPNHVSYAVEPNASFLLLGELAGDFPDEDLDGDVAEICRMIELSGMIGLERGVLEGE